jgi:hypothetical protein
MAMKRIPITEAKAADLAAFAQLNLGLEVEDGMSAARLKAIIASTGYDKDFIETDADDAPKARGRAQAFNDYAAGAKPDTVKLIIQRQPGPGGDEPVFVGVNGVAMYIPRGEEVEVPYRYFEALRNAVVTTYESDERHGLKAGRSAPQYPYSTMSPV